MEPNFADNCDLDVAHDFFLLHLQRKHKKGDKLLLHMYLVLVYSTPYQMGAIDWRVWMFMEGKELLDVFLATTFCFATTLGSVKGTRQ